MHQYLTPTPNKGYSVLRSAKSDLPFHTGQTYQAHKHASDQRVFLCVSSNQIYVVMARSVGWATWYALCEPVGPATYELHTLYLAVVLTKYQEGILMPNDPQAAPLHAVQDLSLPHPLYNQISILINRSKFFAELGIDLNQPGTSIWILDQLQANLTELHDLVDEYVVKGVSDER